MFTDEPSEKDGKINVIKASFVSCAFRLRTPRVCTCTLLDSRQGHKRTKAGSAHKLVSNHHFGVNDSL